MNITPPPSAPDKGSLCARCGAHFSCAMADGASAPCWCVALAPVVAVPDAGAACWCPTCLKAHIAAQKKDSAPPAEDN